MSGHYLSQVAEGLKGALDFWLEKACQEHPGLTPIEKGLIVALMGFRIVDPRIRFNVIPDKDIAFDAEFRVHIQHPVLNYRVDLAVEVILTEGGKTRRDWIAVECDGFDWHHRDREQVTRDKAREREIVAEGYKVLRFSGTEIHRSASSAAEQIHSLALSIVDGWREEQ